MVKKCIVCNDEAEFKIKNTSDYYCKDCAEENFADVSMLIKVEEEAQKLKEYLKQKISDIKSDEEELDSMVKYTENNNDKQDDTTGKD
ncbi:hypothetical protein HOL21_04665 [Candidatus Woesearchaeota archaeon]|jgi:hypothetical protein|nr:hypothetical protein [Candidatus Woesearchaeota archaeon]MBT5397480.1 hypothetical protein [Candidatus Woesearchaeota archaeon]MBT5924621.1 hypothetical protein [Candidatus Woesearchaeota archaeon]MBT6367947.1 hypothetical protein [Candidatus Woesearchaeota archaeon]MBT7763171.1 hypothetical protein [Candidatus Woesearchaeota archaeon]